MEMLKRVYVVQKDHANMDSLPFRFGLHFRKDLILDVFDVTGRRQDFQRSDRFHVDASFRDPDSPKGPVHRGHFVLLEGALPKVVTVWRTDDVETETYLSELIRNLRRDRVVSVDELRKLHPEHVSGRLRTAAQLFAHLLASRTEADKSRLEATAEGARTEATRVLAELDKARRAFEAAHARAEQEAAARRKAEIEKQDAEQIAYAHMERASDLENTVVQREAVIEKLRKELMDERQAARDEGSSVVVAKPDTLVAVNKDVLYRGSLCTELVMGNGTRLYMKTSTFDRMGRVTAKAESLIEQRVKTTCWDPYNDPGKWSSQGYFRNVYPVLDGSDQA